MKWFAVTSRIDHVCDACGAWLEREAYPRSWVCSACHHAWPGLKHLDLALGSRIPRGANIVYVHGAGVLMIRTELADFFDRVAPRSLDSGTVVSAEDKVVRSFVSVLPLHPVVVRGNAESGGRICPKCQRLHYWAMPDLRYVLARDLKTPVTINQLGELLVSESVCRALRSQRMRDLVYKPRIVLELPVDGHPLNLADYRP